MRSSDREEILASHGLCPVQGLLQSVACSTHLRSFVYRGDAFAILGAGAESAYAETGYPWLLGTPAIETHQRWFLRQTKLQIAAMLRRHIFLENWVDARNITSIKWLEWLGFTLHDPQPYGLAGMPFRHFELRG